MFLRYFLHAAKSTKNRSLAGSFEVFQTSNQRTKLQLRTSPIKSFAALVSPHMVALLTSVRNSPCFGGLRRTKTCHRQLFARPSSSFSTFCKVQKVEQKALKISYRKFYPFGQHAPRALRRPWRPSRRQSRLYRLSFGKLALPGGSPVMGENRFTAVFSLKSTRFRNQTPL